MQMYLLIDYKQSFDDFIFHNCYMKTEELSELGMRIQEVCRYKGLNQSELAKILEVSSTAIYQVMAGRTKQLSMDILIKFHQLMRVNMVWLATGEGRMDADSDTSSVLIGIEASTDEKSVVAVSQNFGAIVEKLLSERGKSKKSLYTFLEMTANGFDAMIKNNTMTAVRLGQVADFFGIDASYFYNSQTLLPNKSKDDGAFGDSVLKKMSEDLDNLKQFFEEEIRAKNQQIAGLQRTVDMLAGKSEGAPIRPLSTPMSFEETLRQYRQAVLGQQPVQSASSFFLAPGVAKLVAPRSFN